MNNKVFLSVLGATLALVSGARADGESSFENCFGAEGCLEMNQYDTWTGTSGKIYYTVDGDKMTIYGATSRDSNGNIGNEIVKYQFANNKNLTGITEIKFAGNVEISSLAFQGATNLTKVDLSGVQTATGFRNLSNLREVNLTGVQTIADNAFQGTSSLENLNLNNVERIGANAFEGSGLVNVDLKNIGEIGAGAFTGVTLTNLSLENVETLGDRPFQRISVDTLNLTNVATSASEFTSATINTLNIKDVESVTGFSNTHIENINLENVQTLGASAFYNVTGLKTLDLSGIQEIGGMAFYNSSIESIDLTGVKTIGNYAFMQSKNLTTLTISDSVESMGTNAFYNVKPTDLTISSDKIAMFLMAEGSYSNINNLYCSDGAEACKNVFKALMRGGGGIPGCNRSFSCSATDTSGFCFSILNSIKDAPIASEERQMADGSTALYRNGQLVGFRGKRIYTVEEASMLSKDTGNTIKLRYK